jgi:hypothetical protein
VTESLSKYSSAKGGDKTSSLIIHSALVLIICQTVKFLCKKVRVAKIKNWLLRYKLAYDYELWCERSSNHGHNSPTVRAMHVQSLKFGQMIRNVS